MSNPSNWSLVISEFSMQLHPLFLTIVYFRLQGEPIERERQRVRGSMVKKRTRQAERERERGSGGWERGVKTACL